MFACVLCVCVCARTRVYVSDICVYVCVSPVVFVSLAFVSVFMHVFHNLCLRVWHLFLCVLCMCLAFNLRLCVRMCLAFNIFVCLYVYVCLFVIF